MKTYTKSNLKTQGEQNAIYDRIVFYDTIIGYFKFIAPFSLLLLLAVGSFSRNFIVEPNCSKFLFFCISISFTFCTIFLICFLLRFFYNQKLDKDFDFFKYKEELYNIFSKQNK
jgi:hypothetical protein